MPIYFAIFECFLYLLLCNMITYFYHLFSPIRISKKYLLVENLVWIGLFWIILLSTEWFLYHSTWVHISNIFREISLYIPQTMLTFIVYLFVVWWMVVGMVFLIKRQIYKWYFPWVHSYSSIFWFTQIFASFVLIFFVGYILGLWNPHTFLI